MEQIDDRKFQKDSQSSKGSAIRPEQIKDEEGDDRQRAPSRPSMVLPPSQAGVITSSPGELTPGEDGPDCDPESYADPGRLKSEKLKSEKDASPGSKTQPGYFNVPPVDITPPGPGPVDVQGDGKVGGHEDKDGARRKATILPQDQHVDGEELGRPFHIQWIKTGSLPFGRTRHLRNPWNADREVKVSRDGTEVEPSETNHRAELTISCRIAIHSGVGQALVRSDHYAASRHPDLSSGQPDLGSKGSRS